MTSSLVTRPDKIDAPLYVIAPIFNPIRFRSRWSLYWRFKEFIERSRNVVLVTVEMAMGERDFVITDPDNPYHLRLRTSSELWHKERMINLAFRRLPLDWRYAAWIDADVMFVRPDWANETLHQLQHAAVVQMFNEAIDLDYSYNPLMRHKGFVACHRQGVTTTNSGYGGYEGVVLPSGVHAWHPGFAWAIRRDAYDLLGGLFDCAILGAGDNHMAKSFFGNASASMHANVSPGYRSVVEEWEKKAALLKRDIGFVEGTLVHYWHGPKVARKYWDRWRILVETKFDPTQDLEMDWQGLYRVCSDKIELRDRLRAYFRERNEDALS